MRGDRMTKTINNAPEAREEIEKQEGIIAVAKEKIKDLKEYLKSREQEGLP